MKSNYTKVRVAQFLMFTLSLFAFLTVSTRMNGQTPYAMSSGNYSETFTDISNTTTWPNAFNGASSTEWGSVVVNATGTIPDGKRTSYTTVAFATGSGGGVQRGTANMQFLATGTPDNSTAGAVDLYLDFTGRSAGTMSFDAATVFNATGNRATTLRVYWTTDGTTFTELTGTNLPYVATNNVAGSASIASIALPSAFNGSSTARLRFYFHNGSGGTTGSRPKISIDNLAITSTGLADIIPTASLTDFGSVNVASSSASQSFTVTATGLSTSVTVTAPTGFQVSADDVTFTSSIALTQTAGVLDGEPVTVYVRFSPIAPGAASGNVTLVATGASTENIAVTGTGTTLASNTSDIIVDGGFTYTSNIAYASFQATNVTDANSVAIGQFIIRDGGVSAPDADALNTILNDISFGVTNPGSLRSVALYDGATELGEVPGGATLSFTGLTVAALDDDTKTLTLYATFNSAVTDNQQFSLTIASVSDDNAGSLFGGIGAPTTVTTTDENRIEVTATALTFFVQPTNISTGATMTPSPIVRAVDGLSNRDLDYVTAIDITSSGVLTGSPVSVVPTSGSATYSSIVHTAFGLGRQLTATSGALSVVSNTFNVITLVAAWDFTGENTLSTSTAEVYDALLDNTASQNLLTRGATATASAAANSFRTTGFSNNGISTANTDYFQFTLAPSTGNALSLSTIDARLAGTASYVVSPGVSSQFAYSLNGTTFTLIGSPEVHTATPATLTQIDLSGITALQNVSTGTITFRFYATGQTTTGGWGFTSSAAGVYGLSIGGSVAPVDCNDNAACNYNPLASGISQCQYATTTYYIDIDGDTYASGTILACAPGVGYTTTVLTLGDCDDNNAAANPGAIEIDCDGIDNNCFAGIDEESVVGCQDPLASNYDGTATCPGTCTYAGSFTPGNLVVSRMGAGTAFPTGSTTYQVFLEQMTPAGAAVSTLPMPIVGGTRLTQAASSTAEGFITRTPDGEAVVFAGYDAATGAALTGNARVANIVDLNYTTSRLFSSSTLYTGSTNFRSTVSDGTNAWTSGSGVGINYVTGGTPTLISSAITNTRVINIFNGELYFSTGSGTPGIYKVGTGLPTSSTTNTAVVTSAGSSPYDFVFSPDGNTLYIADDRTTAAGGVYKYTFDGSVWTQAAQFYLGASYPAASSVLVDFYTYAQPKIYVVARLNTNSQSIVASFDDNGTTGVITPTFATISTSPAFTTYRAIEFAPCAGQVWYADADGDTFGNPLVTVTNCTQPYGYVSNSLDCNDASVNAFPGATEICNGGDDDCDTIIDEACINVAVNNNRANATVSSAPNYPTCNNISGNLAAATPDVVGEGADLWYRFTASSNAARIAVSGNTATNTLIEVEDNLGNTFGSVEDASSSNGNEIFLTEGLTIGQQYWVAVRNAGGVAGTYSVCIQSLGASTCDNGSSFSTMCNSFKADWTGATSYSATLTSVSNPSNSYSYTSTSSTFMPLASFAPSVSNIAVGGLQYGQSYSVEVTSVYTLADAAGNIGTYTAVPLAPTCSVSIGTQPNINVASSYTSSGPGNNPRKPNWYISTNQFLCGVVSYNWMFIPVDPNTNEVLTSELTTVYNSVTSTRYMQLNSTNIPGLTFGKRYRVHIQPVFAYGDGSYDMTSTLYIQMISSGGMVVESGNTEAMVTRSFVAESTESTSMAVYPNPTNGEVFNLNVSGIAEGLWEMSILDIQGKVVMNGQLISENGINTMITPSTKLNAGIYMINLSNGAEILSTRLVVR